MLYTITFILAVGRWSSWSAYGACVKNSPTVTGNTFTSNSGSETLVSCGGGVTSKTRACEGGSGCSGTPITIMSCNMHKCPGMFNNDEFSPMIIA